MKQNTIVLIFCVTFMTGFFSDAISETVSNTAIPFTGNDSADIIQFENNWCKALINKDESICRRYLSDNFIYTENDKQYSREEVIQSVLSPSETVENSQNEGMQVYLYGNTAVATGWLIIEGKGADGKFSRKYRYTDIWLKSNSTNNEWQIIAAHDYLMP